MDTPRIIDMVLAKRQRMIQKPEEAIRNSMLGFAAIHGGKRSPAWRAYMLQFVDQDPLGKPVDERQLARLMATDGTDGDLEMVTTGPVGMPLGGAKSGIRIVTVDPSGS